MSMRWSLLEAKNPIERLSGDPNGKRAPSVPAIGCASVLSSARSHKRGGPSPDTFCRDLSRHEFHNEKFPSAGFHHSIVSSATV